MVSGLKLSHWKPSTMPVINNIVLKIYVKKYTGHIILSFVTKKKKSMNIFIIKSALWRANNCIVNKVPPIMQPQPMKQVIRYDFSLHV